MKRLDPRPVVIPALTGGWLTIELMPERTIAHFRDTGRWSVDSEPGDFVGLVALETGDQTLGTPVAWSKGVQFEFVCFVNGVYERGEETFADPVSGVFVESAYAADRRYTRLDVRLKSSLTGAELGAELITPRSACHQAAEWCCDLFPGLDTRDWNDVGT